MKKIVLSVTTLMSLALVFAFTLPVNNWAIVPSYTISFSTSGVSGIFKKFDGTILFDEQNPGSSKFDVTLDVNSINTGNGMQNKHAKGTDWFDAAKFPTIRFTSQKFEKLGNAYQVTGTMQMHGVTKNITIPFRFNRTGKGGIFEGVFGLNRNDYAIGKPGGDVGDVVKLVLSVPVQKK